MRRNISGPRGQPEWISFDARWAVCYNLTMYRGQKENLSATDEKEKNYESE